MSTLKATRVSDSKIEIRYNMTCLGEFIREIDGDFYWYPMECGGAWQLWLVKEIAKIAEKIEKENNARNLPNN